MFAYHRPDDVHMIDANPAWWDTRPPLNVRRRSGADGKEYRPQGDVWSRRRFGVDPGEFSEDRAMEAVLRSNVNRHKSKVDPGTSESVNPRSARMFFLGFGAASALSAGIWALSVLTGAVLQ